MAATDNPHPHSLTRRLIDSHTGARTRPMRVLCLGMPRTGTMSLFIALQRLGYTPYHMIVAMDDLDLWREALTAKYHDQGKKWGRDEFDKLLSNYDSILDVPAICFVEELVVAYPEAKVILNHRELKSWLQSMDTAPGRVLRWNWSMVAPWDSVMALPFWKHFKVLYPGFFGMTPPNVDFLRSDSPAPQAFQAHYELVRRMVPNERLLEYKVQEGWKPLCDFLGVDVPDEDFPRVNDAKQFIAAHQVMWWRAFGKMLGKISAMILIPAAGVALALWWRT